MWQVIGGTETALPSLQTDIGVISDCPSPPMVIKLYLGPVHFVVVVDAVFWPKG